MESYEKLDAVKVVIVNSNSPYSGEVAPVIDKHLDWYQVSLSDGNFWFNKSEVKIL